ncbi:MAG: AAA family ATPase [candidate division KSB1 bacterium]|nr:AAA family ATPase [candidate division KSB1 bacterium]
MSIKKISVKNFKSFKNLELELGNMNLIIGANAAGKSNFVQIFKFLHDIAKDGLENAISAQGGAEYLRNITSAESNEFVLRIESDEDSSSLFNASGDYFTEVFINKTIYELSISFNKNSDFVIKNELLNHTVEYEQVYLENNSVKPLKSLGSGNIKILRTYNDISIDINKPDEVNIKKNDILLSYLNRNALDSHELLIQNSYLSLSFIKNVFQRISIYDFDPKLPKKATPITGKAELEEDGSNLSIILKHLTENNAKRRKLYNLVNDLLPFISDLSVEKSADKLIFKLQETYSDQSIPVSLVSDGTINITALIVALYFENKPLAIIEEPERNIHPHLIAKVAEMMKDASKQKQIIATTHNTEMVRHADLDSLLLVSRDADGFSQITRPADQQQVKTFLKNEIGVEELYIQNLLGG